ncbi:hypothetical protein BS50DRAFT_323971 [Corynespora cassiicola Philippines]|uniref:Secreted protein n=1 Tax=Corynespora cassiicola Philippines TaxID=1448308 RepID=A0A2T2NTJ5_CORCC|nr:hypothetical protein BS50DRAFT_323971 [Corynespora cassiicola Philippines]
MLKRVVVKFALALGRWIPATHADDERHRLLPSVIGCGLTLHCTGNNDFRERGSGTCVQTLEGHRDAVLPLTFSYSASHSPGTYLFILKKDHIYPMLYRLHI